MVPEAVGCFGRIEGVVVVFVKITPVALEQTQLNIPGLFSGMETSRLGGKADFHVGIRRRRIGRSKGKCNMGCTQLCPIYCAV
ncbi:hypothetical protein D3C74_487030 [compost metagenome]